MINEEQFKTNARRSTLRAYLIEIGKMKRAYEERRRRVQANAFDTGSNSSYKSMHKWERRLDILAIAEREIYRELDELDG